MQKVLFFLSLCVFSLFLQACSNSPSIDGDWKFNEEYTVKNTNAPQIVADQIASLFTDLTMNVNTSEKKYTIHMNNIAHESSLEIISQKDNVYTLKVDKTQVEWKIEKDDKGEEVLLIQDPTTGKNIAFSRVKK